MTNADQRRCIAGRSVIANVVGAREQPEVQPEAADDQRHHVDGVGQDEEGERLVGHRRGAACPARRSAHAVQRDAAGAAGREQRASRPAPAIVIW